MIIIGITGTGGAGKGTIVKILKNHNFNHFSATHNIIIPEINKRGMIINRDSMHIVSNDLRKDNLGAISLGLLKMALDSGSNSVIESLRSVIEIELLKKAFPDLILWGIDANQELRYERMKLRKSSKDNISFEKFLEQENAENQIRDLTKQNSSLSLEMADKIFMNDSTVDNLEKQVLEELENVL